ncbi:MAG: hypothetical protein KBC44_01725 [Candidatus Pacebacteria bacterium]|nr:hypothetical protein [Candidatus Paceibacterota bacterium]MBP9839683.1 hypothetical protein [Candidatus Paceibacterota bacterium]MDQ5922698.1 hypothetical protein [Patescibacteria group bacterium]
MDILAHTLWANAGARGANAIAEQKSEPEETKKRKFHMHPGWTAFWGVFPDFFAFTIPFIILFYNVIFGGEDFLSFRDHHQFSGNFDIASYLYQFSHSVVIWAMIFILVWVISKRPRYELLGWLLHILIDIPSHSISFYPTPFLFPISEYRFPYGVSWANQIYMIVNYSFLAIVWSYIVIKKMRQKALFNKAK